MVNAPQRLQQVFSAATDGLASPVMRDGPSRHVADSRQMHVHSPLAALRGPWAVRAGLSRLPLIGTEDTPPWSTPSFSGQVTHHHGLCGKLTGAASVIWIMTDPL